MVSLLKWVISVSKPVIFIRANAGPQTGYGHVIRCIALAEGFREKGYSVQFITNGDHTAIKRSGFNALKTLWLENAPLCAENDLECLKINGHTGGSMIVIDSYQCSSAYVTAMKRIFDRVVLLDDLGHLIGGADVIINHNIYGQQIDYPSSCVTVLAGSQYALVRQSFSGYHNKVQLDTRVENVLVIMGGSDIRQLSLRVLDTLKESFPDLNYRLVIGQGSSIDPSKITGSQVHVYREPENLAALMATSDIAVTAAGSTVYELATIGVPSLMIQVADNQSRIIQGMAQNQLMYSLGAYDRLKETELVAGFRTLLNDAVLRQSMRNRCRLAYDGKGAIRCADALIRLL